MTFSHWLKRFSRFAKQCGKGLSVGGQDQWRVKPRLEFLEHRVVPATYYVTSLGGGNTGTGNTGTLRYLVDNIAADGDTIVFDVSGTINLTGSVSLNHNITIDGNGQTITVNGSSSGVRAFTVNSGATATIEDLTITGEKIDQQGAGISNAGTLTLLNDTITGSNAGGGTGGGIYNSGTLTATDCTIYNNTAGNGNGGGIASSGTLILINDTITGNSGDGILTANTPSTFIENTIIDGNSGLDVSNTAGGTFTSGGGNLYGTSLQVNWVTSGSYPDIQSSNPLLGTFQNNGGYISTFSLLPGSPAIDAGNPNNPTFGTLPTTDQRGYSRIIAGQTDIGAFQNQPQLFTLTAPNTEPSPDAGTPASFNLGSFSYAGSSSSYSVLVNWGDGTTSTFSTTTNGSLASQNHTYYAPGNYLVTITITDAYGNFAQMTTTAAIQGDIVVDTTDDTNAVNASTSPIDSNGTVSLRSAIQYANATGYTGTIGFLSDLSGTISLLNTLGNLQITDANNLTINGSNASITVSGSELSGINAGGVFLINTSASDRIQDLTISGGNALSGGGIYIGNGNLTLSNATISNNSAGSASSARGIGGGIYNSSSGTLTLTDDTITDNSAESNGVNFYSASGGGIYNAGTLTLNNSTINANLATGSGGGIFNSFGTETLNSDAIDTNTALSAGGGVYTFGGTLELTDCTISNNTTNGYFGGGLFNSQGNLTFADDTISNNYSGKTAGGVYNTSGTLTIFNTIVDGNTSLNAPANALNAGGTFTSSGGNLYGASSGINWNTTGSSYPDIFDPGNNPDLASLQSNGGSTQNLAVLSGSLALGSGLLVGQGGATPAATDQRGFTRIVNGEIDVGAFQNQQFTLSGPTSIPSPDAGAAASFNVGSFSDSDATNNVWIVTVNWGDGAADTVFSTTMQGSLGAQSHTYTSAGDKTVTVTINDADNNFSQETFDVVVNPAITFTTTELPSGDAGSNYSQSLGVNGGLGGSYAFSTTGDLDGLTISGGVLSGNPTTAGTFLFTVTASDAGGSGSQSFVLTVNPALTITTSSLPVGTANNAYSQQLSVAGGSGGYSFSTSTTLPNGLSLSTSGLLSGSPTAEFGPSNINILVTDSNGDTQTKSLSLTIDPAITFTTTSIPTGVVNVAYPSTQINAIGGSGGTYTFSASGSLDGLSLSSSGMLTGTPTTTGPFSFIVTATDSNGGSSSTPLTLLVVNPTLTITTTTIGPATVGNSYLQYFSVTGGSGVYSFGETGILPTGLVFNPAGYIYGTPLVASGPVQIAVMVTDSNQTTVSQTYSLKVDPAVTFDPTSLPSFTANVPYSQTLEAAGGSGEGYHYAVTGGTLPGWLNLNSSTGVLSGTPTSATGVPFSFTITVIDSNGATGSRTYSLGNTSAVSLGTLSFSQWTVNRSGYSGTIAITGGTGTYHLVSATGLPKGLTAEVQDGTLTLTGTPSLIGNFTITVHVEDSNGTLISHSYSFTVDSATVLAWTGRGNDSNWSDDANWSGAAPVAGDTLIFGTGAAQQTSVNDLQAGTKFGSLVFQGSDYDITGQAIQLTGGISSTSSSNGNNTLGLDLALPNSETFTIAGTTSLTISGSIGGNTAGLTKVGVGPLFLSGNNSYGGTTTVKAGLLSVESTSALGAGSSVNVVALATLQLDVSGDTFHETLALGSAGTVGATLNLGSGNTWAGKVVLPAVSTFNVATGDSDSISGIISGAGGLSKNGLGTLILSGANTYVGATQVLGGILNVQNNSALGSTASGTVVANGATLQVQGSLNSSELLALNGVGAADSTGALEAVDGTSIWSGKISLNSATAVSVDTGAVLTLGGVLSGPGNLTKLGAGTLVLTAANSYSGGTKVDAGTLAGSGKTGVVQVNSATLAPGAAATAVFTTGNMVMSGSSTFSVTLNGSTAGTGYSQLNVAGTVNLDGATLQVDPNFSPAIGSTFVIIQNDGTDPIVGTFAGLAEGATFLVDGMTFKITYKGGTGNDVVLTRIA